MSNWIGNRRKKSLVIAGALMVVAMLSFAGVLQPLIEPVSGPVGSMVFHLRRLTVAVSSVFFASELNVPLTEGQDLEQTLEQLRSENSQLKVLVAENEALKSVLGYRERQSEKTVLARVVFETDTDVIHGFVIDRGLEDGVSEGMPVIFGEGLIIGKIFEARQSTATVMSLTDSKSRLAVSFQNSDGTVGVLEGDRGLATQIRLIPHSEKVMVGETVITSGLEPGIRRGLLIGAVESVDLGEQDPFQTAVVVPMGFRTKPTYVQVITGTFEVAE